MGSRDQDHKGLTVALNVMTLHILPSSQFTFQGEEMNKIRLQSEVAAAVADVVCFAQTLLTRSLRLVTEQERRK